MELNRISAPKKAKKGFELYEEEIAKLDGKTDPSIKPNNKVAPQQSSAASSISNVPSQQSSAIDSSAPTTKRQKIRAADYSSQSN